MIDILKDETDSWSAARCFLAGWLMQTVAYVWVCLAKGVEPSNAALAVDSGVAIALISWAAGPRIAQYIGGQIGSAASAAGSALKAIAKRRENGDYETTR